MPPRLGQHFLVNPRPIKIAIEALALTRYDTVIEIGPGRGALTAPLSLAVERAGAPLIVIERDRELAKNLKGRFESGVEVVAGDALRELPMLLKRYGSHVKIAGNIPFYITGKLLRILSEAPAPPERAVLLVQREVAKRIIAKAPRFNLLAAAVQFWAEPKLLAMVPRSDFTPSPKVDSALVLFERIALRSKEERERYYKALRDIFRQPRKTVLNNVRQATGVPREKMENLLRRLRFPPNIRPQNLSVDGILRIAHAVEERGTG
ncbi:MAG: 16S rRNA (adenine(1518)-N(6)/adenine(1519)-N(6))-dimethyltransferase RsmA [bacterium]|nr:16S rRNA (adenine(1518)-N(6)/adenine(1519)-N(6))-dimethyltransferase RsmA [bacterium]